MVRQVARLRRAGVVQPVVVGGLRPENRGNPGLAGALGPGHAHLPGAAVAVGVAGDPAGQRVVGELGVHAARRLGQLGQQRRRARGRRVQGLHLGRGELPRPQRDVGDVPVEAVGLPGAAARVVGRLVGPAAAQVAVADEVVALRVAVEPGRQRPDQRPVEVELLAAAGVGQHRVMPLPVVDRGRRRHHRGGAAVQERPHQLPVAADVQLRAEALRRGPGRGAVLGGRPEQHPCRGRWS